MRSTRNQLALAVCVVALLLTWRAHTDRDVVVAQAPKPIIIENITGKGHITKNIGPDDRIVVTIPLEDQTVGRSNR
jgi:hypothetical protein